MHPNLPADAPPSPEDLEGLLEMLYPDPPLVDILTLTDFRYRYRFSGLGAGAVAAIERAQRITRAIGNYDQMGLSEFHNGLIYLYERQYLGALPYFAEARRYWDFENQAPAVCLAHFAQGIAQHGAFHFERALSHYGKVEKCMAQFPVDDATGDLGAFWRTLQAQVLASRQDLLRQVRNFAEGAEADEPIRRLTLASEPLSPPADGEQPTPVITATPARRPSPPPAIHTPASRPSADLPIINLPVGTTPPLDFPIGPEDATEPDLKPAAATAVPNTPIPDHQITGGHLVWMKPDPANWPEVQAFLPDIRADAYILVDKRIENYVYRHNDLVIVDDDEGSGIVPVQPQQPLTATRYPLPIYLGKIEEPPPARSQVAGPAAPKGSIKLSPDTERPLYAQDIIGIVVGIWLGIDVQRLMGSE